MALISNGTTIASGGSLSVSTTPTTSQVASASAGISSNAVGSYAMMTLSIWRSKTHGNTEAGSNLGFCSSNGNSNGNGSGTWRCMGRTTGASNSSSNTSMWLRIS